jgi:hypothetical protein
MKRTGASMDEPQLNMKRKMTDGCAILLNATCLLWMAILNVYPVLSWVNYFFRAFSACYRTSAIGRYSSRIPFIII